MTRPKDPEVLAEMDKADADAAAQDGDSAEGRASEADAPEDPLTADAEWRPRRWALEDEPPGAAEEPSRFAISDQEGADWRAPDDDTEAEDAELVEDDARDPGAEAEAEATEADVAEAPAPDPADAEPRLSDAEREAGVTAAAPAPAAETPPPADHPHDDIHDEHVEEAGGRSLAAVALIVLVGALAVASGTLWLAPKLAPHLPEAVGKYLVPGQVDFDRRIGALDTALAAQKTALDQARAAAAKAGDAAAADRAALKDQIAQLTGRVEAAGSAPSAEAVAAAQAAADAAAGQVAALAGRLDGAEAAITGLRDELHSLSDALTSAGASGEGAAPAEIAAAVSALSKRVDGLASRIEAGPDSSALTALGQRLDVLSRRLDAIESSAAAASKAQDAALGEVSSAIRDASLRAAVAALNSRIASGEPFAAPLAEIHTLTGAEAPDAIAARAQSGLATAETLKARFGPYAQAAIGADVRARAEGGAGGQVLGWLQSQVTGRPITERAGDGVGAITSRIGARLDEGKLTAALAEAETLPTHAQAALDGWLDDLRARVAADAALAGWLAKLGADG